MIGFLRQAHITFEHELNFVQHHPSLFLPCSLTIHAGMPGPNHPHSAATPIVAAVRPAGCKNSKFTIALMANEQLLNEIEVSGQEAAAYHKIDRQTYNAAQFQTATGGTATDVLRNLPAVATDAQGNITVRGTQGFAILLNGRPIQSDPGLILSQLPALTEKAAPMMRQPSCYSPLPG